ncbi:hypothetical protein LCGC14_0476670 [marine sediment metagenome]|uniref:Uncharacterized protein n=1 Tax=marine sediment metagenome TaxID=412755 RepID=A0A0F9SFY8_9ZZZZ
MMEKIIQNSYQNEISVKKVRLVINLVFRMGRQNLNSILLEMTKLGLVKYIDHQTLLILWKPNDD